MLVKEERLAGMSSWLMADSRRINVMPRKMLRRQSVSDCEKFIQETLIKNSEII
jgi:hypothetical protein